MSSMFDVSAFMQTQYDESNSTESIPVPEGIFEALIDKAEVAIWTKKDDPSVSGLKLNITWDILSDEVRAELDRKKVTITQGIMLELTDTTPPALDMGKGKNVNLGKLREALGMNQGSFNFNMLQGQVARIQTKHESWNDRIITNVKAVLPLAA